MTTALTARDHRPARAVLAFSLLFLTVVTTSIAPSAASPPARSQRVAAVAPQGLPPYPGGMLPDTDYAVPADAIHVDVNKTAPGNGDGSAANPFRTLAAGLGAADPGDTIVMHEGEYPESVDLTERVTLQPAPHEDVWLKGSDVHTQWQRVGSIWKAQNWTSPFCQNCYDPGAIDPRYPMAGQPEQAFLDARPLAQIEYEDADGNGIPEGVGSGTFTVSPAKQLFIGDNPANRTVELSNRWNALYLHPRIPQDPALPEWRPGSDGSVIRGIGVANYAPHWNESQLGAVTVGSAFVTLENNAFVRNSATAVGMANRAGNVVKGNVMSYNGMRGMNAFEAHQLRIENNRFESNNTERFAVACPAGQCPVGVAGLKVVQSDNIWILNNTFLNNHGAGFWCDFSCTDAVIKANSVQGNFGVGLYFETGGRATISENWIVDTRAEDSMTTAAGVIASGSEDVTINNNVFVGNVRQLGMYDDDRAPNEYGRRVGLTWDTVRATVTNNTFIPAAGTGTKALLKTLRTSQIDASEMFKPMSGNKVHQPPDQTFIWALPAGDDTYTSLDDFEEGTELEFGTSVP
jgi:hypothetical protein